MSHDIFPESAPKETEAKRKDTMVVFSDKIWRAMQSRDERGSEKRRKKRDNYAK